MIKRIFTNESDLFNLSLKRTVTIIPAKKVDYNGVVVDKPWGYEYLMFENNYAAVWILFLKYKAKTSMHCHPKKKTSLLVLNGMVETSSLDSSFDFKSMEGLIIDAGVFHSTRATSNQGVFIMEIETPPEKNDLVRLKDEYGRDNLGYESGESISSEIDKYEYYHFHKTPAENEEVQKLIKDTSVQICHSVTWKQLSKKFKKNKKRILCPLNYKLISKHGKVILEIGDIIEVKDLLEVSEVIAIPREGLVSLIIS